MTEKDCLEYCYSKGFNWDGLYEKMDRVSCYCCPLQRISDYKIIYDEYPDLWKDMLKMDKSTYRKFKIDYDICHLEDRFRYNSLWNFKDCK